MNPLTNVRNISRLSEQELVRGGKSSWHDQYKDSAWVFVGGLPFELSEGDIVTVFSQYGEVATVNLVRDKETGKSRGFCFLCYEDQRSTVLAVDNLNSAKLLKRTLRVDHVEDYKPPKAPKQKVGQEDPEAPPPGSLLPIRLELPVAPEVKKEPPEGGKRPRADSAERKKRCKKKQRQASSSSSSESSDSSDSSESSDSSDSSRGKRKKAKKHRKAKKGKSKKSLSKQNGGKIQTGREKKIKEEVFSSEDEASSKTRKHAEKGKKEGGEVPRWEQPGPSTERFSQRERGDSGQRYPDRGEGGRERSRERQRDRSDSGDRRQPGPWGRERQRDRSDSGDRRQPGTRGRERGRDRSDSGDRRQPGPRGRDGKRDRSDSGDRRQPGPWGRERVRDRSDSRDRRQPGYRGRDGRRDRSGDRVRRRRD